MRLTSLRVKNFRCVDDSNEFSVGQVTCLVGKNESGKTSILQAIEKINPIDADRKALNPERDYPRRLLSDYNKEDRAIISVWELSDDDVRLAERSLGEGCITGKTVLVETGYSGRFWTLQFDETKVIVALFSEAGCTATEKKKYESYKTTKELKEVLSKITPEDSPRLVTVGEKIAAFRDNRAELAAIDILIPRMPKILYFSNYDRMSGKVSVQQLVKDQAANDVSTGDNAFLAFLEFAGTSLEEVQKMQRYEQLTAKMEGASIKISKQIFAYWSQNRHLKVRFSLEAGRAGDAPPFNAGDIMRTRVYNELHEMTVDFDDRSAGFVWFFSFLVVFSQVKKKFGNVIILLDEPGLNLHGKAQGDLLRYLKEKLSDHQVIYTTHSPFMVPASDLTSVRTVEDVVIEKPDGDMDVKGTKVGDQVLSTDRDTLFPLQGALGYEITQSLFIGEHTLVVEGPSDILYLQTASAELKRRKRTGLDQRWILCPAGGVDKVSAFVSLFSGNRIHVAVLLDFAKGQKTKLEALRKSDLLQSGHIFVTIDFCAQDEADVEDFFGMTYVEFVNGAFGLAKSKGITEDACAKSGEHSPRIVKQVEAVFRVRPELEEFDHYKPALWLLTNPNALSGDAPGTLASLEKFEALFLKLNKLLP